MLHQTPSKEKEYPWGNLSDKISWGMTTKVCDSRSVKGAGGDPIQREYLVSRFRGARMFYGKARGGGTPFSQAFHDKWPRIYSHITVPVCCLGHHRSTLTSADTKEEALFALCLKHHFGNPKLTFLGRDGSAGNTLMAKA